MVFGTFATKSTGEMPAGISSSTNKDANRESEGM